MAVVASELLTEAKILLNDAQGLTYTDAKLIPLLQKAYRELQQKMRRAGIGVTREQTDEINIDAGVDTLSEGAGLPPDIISPISVHEREDENQEWVELRKLDWVPLNDPSQSPGSWAWREEQIKLYPSISSRQVLIRYNKSLPKIISEISPIQISGAETFLASRCAAIAALVIGENESRALALDIDARDGMIEFKATRVNSTQSNPVRRLRNRF